jgi:TolA-binding protein
MRKGIIKGLLLVSVFMGGGFSFSAFGAPPVKSAEDTAFQNAFDRFQDLHFPLAESYFSDFLTKYTNSPHRADAILYLARARLEQSNYVGAIDLLQRSAAEAGGLRHEYLFWIAKARYASGDLTNAAEGFANVAQDFPLSSKRLEASYDQAEARSRMGDWQAVTNLLQQTNGPFQLAAAQDGRSEFAAMGNLLLGEALLHESNYSEGEKVVRSLEPVNLTQDLRWHRQYLLGRLQLAGGQPEAALASSTNAMELSLEPRHQSASVFLQGEILEKLGRPYDALGVYAKNLLDNQPEDVQRRALSRIIPLTVDLSPLANALVTIQTLCDQRPPIKALDLAKVSLGELYLKAAVTPPISALESTTLAQVDTNMLANALTNLNAVITNFTNSPLLAKARLDRGWCEWLAGKMAAAKADFQDAADHLPLSPDQAVALFKLADTQFALKDYSGAAGNYNLVLTRYDKIPEVTNSLFDLALYQIAEADIRNGDADGAQQAVEKILHAYPGSYFGDRGSLLMGEDLDRKTDYAKARAVFLGILTMSPNTPLRPEVEYAIARTFDYESNWNQAIAAYKQWETNHPADALVPAVEFHLALAYGKAGLTNDALTGFTNFVARYPSNNTYAPWALNWVADFYYGQKDYVSAEKCYAALFKYPDVDGLAYAARLWAGRSALAGQRTDDARDHFLELVNLTNAPPLMVSSGYLALGETLYQHFFAGQTNEDYLSQAITAVSKCTNGAPTNAIAVEALGRLADYWMAWANQNPRTNNYATAKQLYKTIVDFPLASVNVAARSQSEFGLGLIAEREHPKSPQEALDHYIRIFDFNPNGFDDYWLERAGESAARICEDEQHWEEAEKVYKRLEDRLPALHTVLEKKRSAAQAHLEAHNH